LRRSRQAGGDLAKPTAASQGQSEAIVQVLPINSPN